MENTSIPNKLPWLEGGKQSYSEFMSLIEQGATGLNTGFKRLDKALEGLQPGLHLIAGESNVGKSFFAGQLAWQVAMQNEKIHVIDVTLDDTKTEKLFRLVAHLTGIPINSIKKIGPQKAKYQKAYKIIEQTVEYLKDSIMAYEILDNAEAGSLDNFCELVKSRKTDLLSIDPDYKLVVFVDSFHDIVPTTKYTSEVSRYDYIAQTVSDLANQLKIPIVCTAELRKLNGIRRPAPDDIRESIKIRYEAKSIMLVYNDVSVRGEDANVYWYKQNDVVKYPVLEVHIAKNKFSTFKGRFCLEFSPEVAFLREPDDATHSKYLDIIYSKVGKELF